MKYSLILSLFVIIFFACDNAKQIQNVEKLVTSETDMSKEAKELLRHVVLFNFNDSATVEVVKKIENAFIGLQDQISEIHAFEWGTNNSTEGLDKGLTHCFFLTFLSEEDRAAYLPHPAHKEFVELIGPFVEDVTVIDYWTKQ